MVIRQAGGKLLAGHRDNVERWIDAYAHGIQPDLFPSEIDLDQVQFLVPLQHLDCLFWQAAAGDIAQRLALLVQHRQWVVDDRLDHGGGEQAVAEQRREQEKEGLAHLWVP
ncbi:hypothetical protein D3C80_1846850 [compost metagenome]